MSENEKNERDNFTMIPNLVDDLRIKPSAHRLYCHVKRVCGEGDNGECWQSIKTLVKCTGLGRSTVIRAKKELEAAGLIKIKNSHDGLRRRHVITIVDIWEANEAYFANRGPGRTPGEHEVNINGKMVIARSQKRKK